MNANAPWFRPGMIIATGICYTLTSIGCLRPRWGEEDPQPRGRRLIWFDLRNNSLIKPRLPNENSMVLCAAIAHPRIWTPQVKCVLMAPRYLFRKAPEFLPIPGKSIFIKSEAPSGLFYICS